MNAKLQAVLFLMGTLSTSSCGGGKTPPSSDGSTPSSPSSSEPTSEAAGGSDPAPSVEEGPEVGKKAPEVKGAQFISGTGPKTLAEAKGKVVILDFWGTYCKPCVKSFPEYQKIQDKFGQDLVILAVSADDPDDADAEKIKKWVKDSGVKFAVVWDKDRTSLKRYDPPNMPTAYLIDKEGIVRHVHPGYVPGDEKKMAAEIQALIGR